MPMLARSLNLGPPESPEAGGRSLSREHYYRRDRYHPVVAGLFAPDPAVSAAELPGLSEIGNCMPDVLANRIGGIVDREFLLHVLADRGFALHAVGCTRSGHAGAAKRRVAPHGR